MGFEPTTSTLARLRSTPELRPRSRCLKARRSYAKAGALQGRSCRRSLSLAALRQVALKVSIPAMPKTPKQLLARLDELHLETSTVEHPPVFTVEESKAFRGDLAGGHTKNLFLKDKKGQLWLVVALEDRAIDMKMLRHRISSAPLSFGKSDLLEDVLGIPPGSVTPFALINDSEHRVRVVLDKEMMGCELLNYHPLTNAATTQISPAGLMTFIRDCGHDPVVMEL